MPLEAPLQERRTSADLVFDHLHEEIISLKRLPGDKISEVEIATLFGVSRQPVRDAFNRLSHLDLLLVRPQKATEVKRFSRTAITTARFVRKAIELEVGRQAIANFDAARIPLFEHNLTQQRAAQKARDIDSFHRLDYQFHQSLCDIAGTPFAFDEIMVKKTIVDRLCMLSLTGGDAMGQIVADHESIVQALVNRDAPTMEMAIRVHLSRLDSTIEEIQVTHAGFFDA